MQCLRTMYKTVTRRQSLVYVVARLYTIRSLVGFNSAPVGAFMRMIGVGVAEKCLLSIARSLFFAGIRLDLCLER